MDFKDRPVGEIVTENYHAAGVFREFGIDFCCGGSQLLSTVCEKRGVDLHKIKLELENSYQKKDSEDDHYNDWSPSFLIDYIVNNHHSYVRRKTPEITAYAAKVARVHGERHPENVKIYRKFTELVNELEDHLMSEENSVFPLIKSIGITLENGGSVDAQKIKALRQELDQMETEHEGAGKLMAEISELSNRFTPPEDACATYRILYQNLEGFEQDLHKHVHLENNILFKKAEELLNF